MSEKDKFESESKNNINKRVLADQFFKRFVENEDQINFTNEDVITEIKNLEKNLKKYEVLEIVLDCCSEEIISDHIANTWTTYEDFIDCFIFADNLGSRLSRYLKGDLLNIYNLAEEYWHLIVKADNEREEEEYLRMFKEDTFEKQIREHGGYRNYLKDVKPEEKCGSCGKELREHEGYYSRGDNVYCLLCKKDLIWCKSCRTYVRPSDFEWGNDIMCKYCENPDGSFESHDTHITEPDFEVLDVLREREMIKKYENDVLAEKPYDDHDLAEIYENLTLEEDFSKPAEMILEDERIELIKFLSNKNFYSCFFDEPKEAEIGNGILRTTLISQIQPGKVYLIKGMICELKSLFIHTTCIQCRKNIDDCGCQDNGGKKEILIIHLRIDDGTESIDCIFLDSLAEKLVHKKGELIKQITDKPDFKRYIDNQNAKLLGKIFYIQGKVEFWESLKRLIIIIKAFKDVDIEEELNAAIKKIADDL